MKYNSYDESDAKAAKTGLKAGKLLGKKAVNSAAGKAATAASKKFILWLLGALGVPGILAIIAAIIVLTIFPAVGFTSTMGTDANTDDTTNIMYQSNIEKDDIRELAKIEEKALEEMEKRAAQLSKGAFWEDMKSFFSTGKWGNTRENFETELANAKIFDEEGNEILGGYSSSFNRLVAIINQSFIASLQDSKVLDWAEKEAERMIEEQRQEYVNKALAALPFNTNEANSLYPSSGTTHYSFTDGGAAKVTLEDVVDPNIDGGTYLYEACFLITSSSVKDTLEDDIKNSTGNVLDLTFEVTGLNGIQVGTPLIWETVLLEPEYTGSYHEISRRYEDVPNYGYVTKYYLNGSQVSKAAYEREANNPDTTFTLSTYSGYEVVGYTKHTYITMEYRRHGDIYYGAEVVPDFQDIVLHELDFETQEEAEAKTYDSEEERGLQPWRMIDVQNEQLLSLYAESRNLTKTKPEDLVFTGDVPFRNKELQMKIVETALVNPPPPQSGYCLKWTNDVYQRVFGTTNRATSALAALKNSRYATNEGYKDIEVGAMIYGSSDRIDPRGGHVAIYIGDGKVVHNYGGSICEDTLADWASKFGDTIRWGWQGMEYML